MEKDPKRSALSKFMMSPEEIEAYAEPSIMDEYIRENDPEQYDKIVYARNLKQAIGMTQGIGGPSGVIGMLGKFKPTRVPFVKGKHLQADIQKLFSRQDLNPEAQNFGKVIQRAESPEQIGNVTGSLEKRPLTLEERVDAATEKEKALFQRLLELTGKTPKD